MTRKEWIKRIDRMAIEAETLGELGIAGVLKTVAASVAIHAEVELLNFCEPFLQAIVRECQRKRF
jgi:hypothetical protein